MPDLNGCSDDVQPDFSGRELLFRVLLSLRDLQIPLSYSESVPGSPGHIRSLWLPWNQPQKASCRDSVGLCAAGPWADEFDISGV